MKKLAVLVLCIAATYGTVAQTPATHTLRTFLFVHGAWGGGWEYKTIDSILTAQGDGVYHPTMTGLGERMHLANPDISLKIHITDIVNVFRFEYLHDIILVGHR